MIDSEKKTITITSEDGDEKEFDILFMFADQDKNREYVVFTDYSPSKDGGTSLSAAAFDPADPETLEPIEKEEWDIVYSILEEMQKNLEAKA